VSVVFGYSRYTCQCIHALKMSCLFDEVPEGSEEPTTFIVHHIRLTESKEQNSLFNVTFIPCSCLLYTSFRYTMFMPPKTGDI
jgi:hypothetical protein